MFFGYRSHYVGSHFSIKKREKKYLKSCDMNHTDVISNFIESFQKLGDFNHVGFFLISTIVFFCYILLDRIHLGRNHQ